MQITFVYVYHVFVAIDLIVVQMGTFISKDGRYFVFQKNTALLTKTVRLEK